MDTQILNAAANLGPLWADALTFVGFLVSVLAVGFGAVSATNVRQGSTLYVADIISSAAGDTTITLAHGLGAISVNAAADFRALAPQIVTLTPRSSPGWLSRWRLTSINSTSVVLNKTASTSSLSAAVQLTVAVQLPHSIAR